MAEDIESCEARRPGITKLFNRIRNENPTWTGDRCLLEAKMLYSNRTIAKLVDGQLVTMPNPDYGGSE